MKKGSSASRQGRASRRICHNRGRGYDDTHYIFLQQSDDSSDQDEGIQLQTHKEQYLEKELEPGDTLHTLSIQFNCPIAELKRINHIHRENEIFARRKIKVPAKYYSLLSEREGLVGVHKTPSTSKEGSTRSLSEEDLSPLHAPILNEPSQENFDRPFCDNISPLSKDVCDNDSTLLEESQPKQDANEVFQCNGSDWGLSWPQLLFCTLLLGFAGPIVYIFYLKEVLEEKNGGHFQSNTTSRPT